MNVSPNTISRILTLGDDASIGASLVIGLKIWKKATTFWRLIVISVALDAVTELIGNFYRQPSNSAIGFNIYILILLWLLVIAALYVLRSRVASAIGVSLLVLSTVLWSYYMNKHGIRVFANWVFVSSSIFVSGIYFIVFIQFFSRNQLRITGQPLFWLCLAMLIYYCATIPIFSMFNYLNTNNLSLASRLYLINIALCIVYNLLVSYSFLLYHKNEKAVKL
jgi:hypothetical protein